MDDLKEQMIYNYICQNYRGKDELIKNKELRRIFNIKSDKSMRKYIQNIRKKEKYKNMIGSVSGKTGGFYMCITSEEKEDTINNIKHRAYEMLKMCEILERKVER